jgi:DNA repair exonuclease SbcCD ATPase subunit
MATDLEQLLEYGFPEDKAKLALKKTGNLSQALDWLSENADKSYDELLEADKTAATDPDAPPPAAEGELLAKSLVCNDCGKSFRTTAQAEWHATKTQHQDFSESTEEIAPLTEEQKKAKLEELRSNLAAKRAAQAEADKAERKQNEEIRRKNTKEGQDAKERMAQQEQIKEAEKKRREKKADADARKAILAKIEEDKADRKRKAEAEKAAREGRPAPAQPEEVVAPPKPAAPRQAADYKEARLRLQTPAGTITKSFPVGTTLFEVAHAVAQENGHEVASFTTTFPKKTYDSSDFGQTLKEAGWVPSAALIVK